MSRGLTVNQRDASLATHRVVVPLLELNFLSGTLRFAMAPWDILDGATVYMRTSPILSVDKLSESVSSREGLKFTMSGLDTGIIDLAVAEPYAGRLVRLLKAYIDPDTNQTIGTPKAWWLGRMRTLQPSEQNDLATVTLTAEHFEVQLLRASPIRVNDADQQRLHPGDLGCQYMETMTEKQIVWPAKEALYQ